jgi:hypothetical protein
MPRPKVARRRTTVDFTEDLYAEMEATALERDISIAHLVRDAVRKHLNALPPLEPTGNGRRQSA